jgi:hypothetical protein
MIAVHMFGTGILGRSETLRVSMLLKRTSLAMMTLTGVALHAFLPVNCVTDGRSSDPSPSLVCMA